MSLEPTSLGPNWWISLTHGGLLIAPGMVDKVYGDDLPPLSSWHVEALRRALTNRAETGVNRFLDTVFLRVLSYLPSRWNRSPSAEQWSHTLITGDSARPQRLLLTEGADAFPIFTEKPDIRIGYHRGRQSVARVVEWLRKAGLKVALLATEQQWRLIYAGPDFEAWCEWNPDLWFESGQPSLQVEALRRLLGRHSLPTLLVTAIQESRRGQAELTSALGERVREAVEKLIQSSAANLETLDVLPSGIYLAATRIVMRCVVALFAEGKGMLGRDLPAYHDSYGIQGLREQLERISITRPEVLFDEPHFAWPRIVSLFRLIHSGSVHPQFTTMRYGGTLFEPGDPHSPDPVLRAIAAFEATHPCPSDSDVHEILTLLTRTYVKVSQGRGARVIPTPVDFSNLDTEYIGILYEGLLDYDLKRAAEPVVFLRMGDEPALRISELEQIPPAKLKDVFGKLNKKSEMTVAAEEGEDAETDDAESAEEIETGSLDLNLPTEEILPDSGRDPGIERARQWALAAVTASGRVRPPRRQTEQAKRDYEAQVDKEARALFTRIVRTGDWYLVRFGNTRKGSGTFYTRKELAGPTVRRTLAPLVRDTAGTPFPPEKILSFKVCDPAVGSGSFLISALRYLTDALFDSLHVHTRFYSSGGNRCYKLGVVADECVPEGEEFEELLRARLRRHVVERCLYGVDLNPLAVELARMSLWIETMNPSLPFGFLDHKLKAGNSLVGCWFDRFQDYPIQAWQREGGDKKYDPVNPRPNWTKSIAAELSGRVKPNLVRMIEKNAQQNLPLADGKAPAEIYREVREHLNGIHALSLTEPDLQRAAYATLRANPGFERLRLAFDCWCALWFWPGDKLKAAPIAADFLDPSPEAITLATELREDHKFFHWELEFPDVFTAPQAGFDAVVGNPPWEIQKPNSKEFFSNIDPLYRGYGKQEAVKHQQDYFQHDFGNESKWMAERARLKALSNWTKFAGTPFGEGAGATGQDLYPRWGPLRRNRAGYADSRHPFQHQGSADLNTYKMFLEAGYRLLRESGRLGMIVPSGIYSDQGSTALRTLFLEHSSWEWLFSFENRDRIFDIDSRFKFNPLIVQKGGRTETVRTGFMHHALQDWEDAEKYALDYPGDRVLQFSPVSKSLLEVMSLADLVTVETLSSTGKFLSGSDPSWNIRLKREFHMTDDIREGNLRPRHALENEGFRASQYGYWLKGPWQQIGKREKWSIVSADGSAVINPSDLEDIALPVYQGVMIQQFSTTATLFSYSSKTRGTWVNSPNPVGLPAPQYLMKRDYYYSSGKRVPGLRLLYRVQGGATNERTMIGSLIDSMPFGNSLNALWLLSKGFLETIGTVSLFCSYVHDWLIRQRVAGSNVSSFKIEESIWPNLSSVVLHWLATMSARLNLADFRFSERWLALRENVPEIGRSGLPTLFALTPHERLRLRCVVDAAIASLYGLNLAEFGHVLFSCDQSESDLSSDRFTRTLDQKGFWRVDKEQPPHLRHTVLSLIAFHELERIGLDAFLALNDGEGWMLPETLRLADYGLGHDDRAKEHQPVASVLGPRFYDWQLSQSVEESWEECARHAELLAKIVPQPSPEVAPPPAPPADAPTDLFGDPVPTDLFGNAEFARPGRKRP